MPGRDAAERAREVLRGATADPHELIALAGLLIETNAFGYARRVLAVAASSPEVQGRKELRRRILTRQTIATYKDADLAAPARIENALEILNSIEDLSKTHDQEILGLAGAIYKRQFEIYARTQSLERALGFYMRGYQEGLESDYGYTAINAAFVLDLLASQEQTEAEAAHSVSETAQVRREHAAQIRKRILATLARLGSDDPALQETWWFAATLAEAAFGLRQYDESRRWLERVRVAPVTPWQRESTARQLCNLARVQHLDVSGLGWLGQTIGIPATAMRSILAGKVGLALSGGGFRAALFQVGVLARLAELDALRDIEVISCVAGGSVVGAYYYLELKRLLEIKPDGQIDRQDYIDIVQALESNLLQGIQQNLRVRLYANVSDNLKAIFRSSYSRAERLARLLEQQIFVRVRDSGGLERAPRYMSDLRIKPLGEHSEFDPKFDNWRRGAKVPTLIINATTLNTAHNWQFTASWMGEPPGTTTDDTGDLDRLRRMYYDEAPQPYRRIRLGTAVAASACTPGLLDPISFPGLYPGYTVRLVDGGVHDNQGVSALVEQDVNVLIVADGSGLATTARVPSAGILDVLNRTNAILFNRVRGAQYRELETRARASLVRGLVFLHLHKDLKGKPVDWIGSPDSSPRTPEPLLTPYGIRKDVQERLSAIRSDLDAFHDMEAYSLMTSGYLMTRYEFPRRIGGFPDTPPENWRFLVVEEGLRSPVNHDLLKLLDVSSARSFKVFRLSPILIAGLFLCVLVVAVILLFSIRGIPLGIILWVVVAIAALIFVQVLFRRDPLSVLGAVGTAIVGPIAAGIYLTVFHPIYLAKGRASAVPSKSVPERAADQLTARDVAEGILNRTSQVDSVALLFESIGWHVVRYPRERDLNPLGVDVDLLAENAGEFYFVKVCTPDTTVRAVDWIPASDLKRGAWALSRQRDFSPKSVKPLLVMLDVAPDPSLVEFSRHEDVSLVISSRSQVESTITAGNADAAKTLLGLSR